MSAAVIFCAWGLYIRLVKMVCFIVTIESKRDTLFCFVLALFEAEERFYVSFVHLGDKTGVGEVAFLLFGLFGKDVAVVSVFTFDFS